MHFKGSQIEMEFFATLKGRLSQLGIFNWDSDIKAKRIALAKRCGITIICISFPLSSAWYVLFEAEEPRQHSEGVVAFLGSSMTLWWNCALILQRDKYVAILDELNTIINKSKPNIYYFT